jgi:chemotaxis protein MotB
MRHVIFLVLVGILIQSCVGKKKYLDLQDNCGVIELNYNQTKQDLDDCRSKNSDLREEIGSKESLIKSQQNQIDLLRSQLEEAKQTKTDLLDRLADLSVINKTGAESIAKSLEAINEQNKYIKDLTGSIQKKDSVNLALVMNLKRSLDDINDEDVQVEVKKGVVYVSLSDKLLFASGSDRINERAKSVLSKVAKIINDRKDLDILVEGHTDDVPIKTACVEDNWDLSVQRATSVVRLLQSEFNVDPARLTAGGRGEYVPKAQGDSAEARKINRRTEIIITPKLDQFFKLLAEQPK